MKRLILSFLLVFFSIFLFAKTGEAKSSEKSVESKEQKLLTCYKIFQDKKKELEMRLEKIQEEEQAFQALKDASMNLLKKKEERLKRAQLELNKSLEELNRQKKENEELIKKYQKILQEIKEATSSKLAKSYSKMRPSSAAQILEKMDTNSSLEILSKLSPKVLAKIFAKMDPEKAAFLTEKSKNFTPQRSSENNGSR